MLKEYKQVFSNFIDEDRFELHSYLTYLFIQSISGQRCNSGGK